MKQSNLFEFGGINGDPLYSEIESLTQGKSYILIGRYKVIRNSFGLFEITAEGIFDCAGSVTQCYHYFHSHTKYD
ncbi:hypothetical protein [Halobacillus andaensis]|uniref:hypothetical protein n=1 Tax=Halobacillus andaensis TaxID=1176239 RepID=UPI003D723CAD